MAKCQPLTIYCLSDGLPSVVTDAGGDPVVRQDTDLQKVLMFGCDGL